jgi:hypothetical protein
MARGTKAEQGDGRQIGAAERVAGKKQMRRGVGHREGRARLAESGMMK